MERDLWAPGRLGVRARREGLRRGSCSRVTSGAWTHTCAFEAFARQLWFVIVCALFSERRGSFVLTVVCLHLGASRGRPEVALTSSSPRLPLSLSPRPRPSLLSPSFPISLRQPDSRFRTPPATLHGSRLASDGHQLPSASGGAKRGAALRVLLLPLPSTRPRSVSSEESPKPPETYTKPQRRVRWQTPYSPRGDGRSRRHTRPRRAEARPGFRGGGRLLGGPFRAFLWAPTCQMLPWRKTQKTVPALSFWSYSSMQKAKGLIKSDPMKEVHNAPYDGCREWVAEERFGSRAS